MEAIETCPVDCIHYMPFDDLIAQELARDANGGPIINFKARLVGSEGFLYGGDGRAGLQEAPALAGDSGMRCGNCPSLGCYKCPMFPVGESPYYVKKRMAIDHKRKLKKAKKKKQVTSESSDEAEL